MGNRFHIGNATGLVFVYCAFATDGDFVYVKVGISGSPFKRIANWIVGCPFQLEKVVFTHAGFLRDGYAIERSIAHAAKEFRMRGEWYRFSKDQGKVFSQLFMACYKRIIKRDLKWTHMDMDQLRDLMYIGSRKKWGIDLEKQADVA